MKGKLPPVWLSLLVLLLTLLWRSVGAPLTQEQFRNLEIPFWQARILLPVRVERILMLWPVQSHAKAEEATETVRVYMNSEEAVRQMSMQEYVCGVVAAEMPAAYHLEALKAQAVAARTRVIRQQKEGGCSAHPSADICTDSTHCQAYASEIERQERWQEEYPAYQQRVAQAERETRGEYISYQGQPIEVVFHAISGGRTEDAKTVFSQGRPYLISVESTGEEQVRGFQEERFLSFEEIAERISPLCQDNPIDAQDVQQSLAINSYTETGRVKSLVIGSVLLDASDFRAALDLRSTWFTLSSDEKGIIFHQRGYGHGVGMSQAGANAMAACGANYRDILMHYYPGVSIETQMGE